MAFYQFRKEQFIRASVEEVWDFISSPENLKCITPPSMGFDIRTPNLPEKVYEGMIIAYRVRPLLGISTSWVTEITHVKDKSYFVDEQRIGPYKMWHHQHFITPEREGLLMTDIVSYQPPLGCLGAIAKNLVIDRKLNEIFDFRTQALQEIFTP